MALAWVGHVVGFLNVKKTSRTIVTASAKITSNCMTFVQSRTAAHLFQEKIQKPVQIRSTRKSKQPIKPKVHLSLFYESGSARPSLWNLLSQNQSKIWLMKLSGLKLMQQELLQLEETILVLSVPKRYHRTRTMPIKTCNGKSSIESTVWSPSYAQ